MSEDIIVEDTIATVYGMMYPYGKYSGDVSSSCLAINRELKNLCNKEMRHILLIIARYLHIKFKHETTTTEICGKIQDNILNLCFSDYEVYDEDRARFIIGLKTGVVDIPSDLSLIHI